MTSRRPENNKFSLKSIVSDKLTNKEIKEICLLKDKQWKLGIKSQLKWFKNNIKKYDLHNLFYIKSKLVGYTLLRKRTYEIKDLTKKTNYLYFDTLVIDKKYRGMKLSNLLMSFNNTIIKYIDNKKIVLFIFSLIFIFGSLSVKDYGVSSDEHATRIHGFVNLNYIGQKISPQITNKFKKDKNIPNLHDKDWLR